MTPITNIEQYNASMAKSMEDKLWFVEKLKGEQIDIIVDYGCADGEMLLRLSEIYPDAELIGYDQEQEMVRKANARVKAWITDDWPDIKQYCETKQNVLLIMSSVIHEIFSFNKIPVFTMVTALSLNAKYVAIRDMCYPHVLDMLTPPYMMCKIYKHADPDQIKKFEDKWGPVGNLRNAMHYLLKYRYKRNWNRELEEDYMIIDPQMIDKMPGYTYHLSYVEYYTLPFLKQEVLKDFDFELKEATHVKILLSKR